MKNFKKNIVIIVLFSIIIGIFSLFGKENIIIGMTTFLTAVTLFNDDYTVNALRNILNFVILEIALGIMAYIGSLNIILGIISIFIVTLYIYYNFTYNTKISKASGFITSYLLLLYIPVNFKELPFRLMALALSGVLMMLLYYLIVGKKYLKGTITQIKGGIDIVSAEIEDLLKGEDIKEKYIELSNKLQILESRILNTISKLTNIDIDLERRYAIFLFVKRLNNVLVKLNGQKIENREFLQYVNELINCLGEISKSNEKIDEKLKELEKFTLKISSQNAYYIYNIFEDTKEILEGLKAINSNEISYLGNKENFKRVYRSFYNKTFKSKELKSLGRIGSLKWNFAIKSSLMISIGYFIVTFFNIPEGKWLLFTIAVVSLPFSEQINKKGRDRIIGTIVGVIAFDFIFTFIHYKPILIVFLIISVYCMLSIKDYSKKAIFITFMSLSMANFALGNPFKDYYVLSLERLGFVLLGTLMPYIVSKVFPYRLKDKTEELKKDLVTLVCKMEDVVKNTSVLNGEKGKEVVKLAAIMKFTCSKLYFNNTQLQSEEITEILRLENSFIMDVYYLIKNLRTEKGLSFYKENDMVKDFIALSEGEKKVAFYNMEDEKKRFLLNLLNLKKSTEAMKSIAE
ncbi:MAG: FUSC family protein [Clostridium sp.]